MSITLGKIQPGMMIGRCQIVRELGRGGMGAVYLAAHKTLKIDVALKILSPSLVEENPDLAERFIREAQLAARIRHPNVIAVMDADLDPTTGLYFMVQEYIAGGSLSWHLRNGPLPEKKALEVITGIAQALILAEENGIIHRDIKPDNIMLDVRGTAKLADLGLAKQALDTRSSLTLGGSFMGTPAYMSPDQARDARNVTTRDDIYSLGATFFECLTGRPPFQGDTPYNIMSELLTKPSPHPRDFRSEISVGTDLICRKMMAKSRQLRYENARALVQDLEQIQALGDSGRSQLLAAHFDDDRKHVAREARSLGIETTSEGTSLVPDHPEDAQKGRIAPQTPALIIPRRADYGVFGTAGLLLSLVTLTTLLLVLLGPYRPWAEWMKGSKVIEPQRPSSTQKNDLVVSSTQKVETKPLNPVDFTIHDIPDHPLNGYFDPFATSRSQVEPNLKPNKPDQTSPPLVIAPAIPVDLNAATTNAVISPLVTPATPAATHLTAFHALQVAEQHLGETSPAQLVEISSEHDITSLEPTTWIFTFYQEHKWKNARYIRVQNDQVVSDGDHFGTGIFASYHESDVLDDAELNKDSDAVLQIAMQKVPPGKVVISSEMQLGRMDKHSLAPIWTVKLWGRSSHSEEEFLGTVRIFSDDGKVFSCDFPAN